MQKTLTLGTIVLGCCLAVMAQTSSYQKQTPSGSSTPDFSSQGQAGQSQSYPSSSADQSDPAMQSSNQKTTVQGCLTQSPEGNFMLADASGKQYQLNESSSRLGQFVGQEIRVDGFGIAISESSPGAMSSATPSGPEELKGSVQQIDVSKVRKVADTCQTSSSGESIK
jgi:hypothetical protein